MFSLIIRVSNWWKVYENVNTSKHFDIVYYRIPIHSTKLLYINTLWRMMYKMQFAWMRRIFLLKIECSHRGSSTWSCYDIPAFIMHQQWKSSKSTFWNHIEWYKWNCILKSDRFFIEWCRAWSLAWRQPMQRQPMGQNRAVTFWKCVAPPPKYCYNAYIVTCIDICIILYINTLWCIMYNLGTRCFPYSSE